MKKLFLLTAAFAVMLFTSCEKEEMAPAAKEATVTYTVELPSVQTKAGTKAIGDGFNVNQLVYEVWKTDEENQRVLTEEVNATRLYQDKVSMQTIDGKQKCVITLNLVHDQNYTILFWAQYADNVGASPYYNTDNLVSVGYKNLENGVPANYLSNHENMAAFYGAEFITADEVEKSGSMREAILKRPFAQLNIGTLNTPTDYIVSMQKTTVTIKDVPTVFNVAENRTVGTSKKFDVVKEYPAVSNPKTFVFGYEELPSDPSTLTVNNTPYHYAAMNYIFAPEGNVTVDYKIKATLTADQGYGNTTQSVEISKTVLEVPLKENYRTNIVGNLLSSTTQYEVVIDANWDDVNDPNWDGRVEEVWDEKYVQEPPMVNGAYEISLASELSWLAAQVNAKEGAKKFSGVTFKLVEDIDFNDPNFVGAEELLWNPIGATGRFEGIFDGQNHIISNLKVKAEGKTPAGLFGKVQSGTVKNVTVVNANVQGHYSAAVVVAHGVCAKISNCHVENATVISTPYNKDEANNIGAIAGFLGADGGSAWVKDCSVKNADITAYRKVGGIVGAANQAAVVTGNSVENIRVTADQTAEYKEVKAADLGEVAGYIHKNADVSKNTVTNVTLVHKVNSVEEMQNAAKGAQVILSAGEYNIQEDAEFSASIQIIDGDASVYSENNTITTGNDVNYGFITKGENSSLVFDANVNFNGGGFGATDGSQITINGGSVAVNATTTNPRYNIYAVGNGTTVTINDGNFSISKLTLKRAYIYAGAGATVYVKGGTFGKASSRSGYTAGILGEGNVIITGGTFGFDPTNWVAVGYVALKEGENWVVKSLSEPKTLEAAVAVAGATVNVAAGEYKFPSSSIAAGVTINCAEGTVFTGTSKLNINGATVIGAKFSNPTGTVADQTINGTFKNCTFEGVNGLRYAYAGETVVFENCVFSGSTYGAHFDGGENDILFKNCTFSGFNAFASKVTLVTFDGCTFKSNGRSNYNGANLWGKTVMTNTKFVFDGTAATEWIGLNAAKSGLPIQLNNCLVEGTDNSIFTYFANYNSGDKVTINDIEYTLADDYHVSEGIATVYNPNGFIAALKDSQTHIKLLPGTYELITDISSANNIVISADNVTIEGTDKDDCIVEIKKQMRADQKSITLKNLTVDVPTGLNYTEHSFAWIHYLKEFNMIDCNSNGRIRLNSYASEINNCTFNVTTSSGFDGYAIFYYGPTNSNTKVVGCTFNTAGKAIVMYNESKPTLNMDVENCTFNSTDSTTDKAAIQMHTEWGINGTLDIKNCTATGFANINGGLWNEINNNTKVETDQFEITVDGNKVH